ncbi:uncharacterized protein LOC110462661 [Mizuhopecten yessoensis]|uniref:C2H2-type domain-containing protein n=1 Tax=Mizuhopecten yessoensis TaxID=6573 RepID=A0A210PXT2_MIZYE|nr:uncharacterized protein LOC110462661 [Mizuhopecten yessoensis]XP_021372411.1 uncharacterized protein LOC110462661 [Mizuhopecten yessoensis]OWF41291.1 hypothetical protein KP79_PYT13128 [Mizuhopecten yessoensis]
MENSYTEEFLKKKAAVCGQLQRAVVKFCEQTYAGITHSNLEVDGIICISFSNSHDQHVVKIHEKLGKGRKKINNNPESDKDSPNANLRKGSITPSHGKNSNRISDEAVGTNSQGDGDVLSYNEQENVSLQFDVNGRMETFTDENVIQTGAKEENLSGIMENIHNSRKQSKSVSLPTDGSLNKKKKQFVESVEGNYVIVKVEPDDLDAEEQANLKDSDIAQSCYSQSTKTSSFSPKSGSYIRHDSVEKLSVVDDSNDTMYMVTSDFHSGPTNTEEYPYQPSINNCKSRDIRSNFIQGDSCVQFATSSHTTSTPDVSDLNQHAGVNNLTRNRYPPDSIVLDTYSTKQINNKSNKRNTGSIKQSPKNEDFDPNVFQNFNLPLAPLDPMPVPHPIGLSSESVGSSYNSETQLKTSLSSQYYNYNNNTYSSSFSVSSSSHLPGPKPKLSSSIRPHSNYSNRGRSSALSHVKRASAVAMSRNVNFSTKHMKRIQKSSVPNFDLTSKTQFGCPPSDSFIPNTSDSKHKMGLMDLSGQDKLFFCRYCGKGFTMKCTRSRHEKTICSPAGTGSYRCELCTKSFTRSDSRYRHMFKAHGIQS